MVLHCFQSLQSSYVPAAFTVLDEVCSHFDNGKNVKFN